MIKALPFIFCFMKGVVMKTIIVILALLLLASLLYIIVSKLTPPRPRPDGLLNVDTRDPEKDYYDFVWLLPMGDIPKRRFLTVEVSINGQFSQGENSEKKR